MEILIRVKSAPTIFFMAPLLCVDRPKLNYFTVTVWIKCHLISTASPHLLKSTTSDQAAMTYSSIIKDNAVHFRTKIFNCRIRISCLKLQFCPERCCFVWSLSCTWGPCRASTPAWLSVFVWSCWAADKLWWAAGRETRPPAACSCFWWSRHRCSAPSHEATHKYSMHA